MIKKNGPGADSRVPINFEEILQVKPHASVIIADAKIAELPLSELEPEEFEKLCAEVLAVTLPKINQTFRYGRPGQAQYGIDVIATRHDQKPLVAQIKRWSHPTSTDIIQWVDKFLDEFETDTVSEYVLAVACEMENDRNLMDAWRLADHKLQERGITSTLWDIGALHTKLRKCHSIVEMFYGPEVVHRFCETITTPDKYPIKYREQYQHQLGNYLILENRSVRLDLFLPTTEDRSVSAGLYFARADVNGITLGVDGKEVVKWMQWRAHAGANEKRPYLVKHSNTSKWILVASGIRLTLEEVEVEEFDWLLTQAWPKYLEAAKSIDAVWRASQFPRISVEESHNGFGLLSLEVEFWRAVLGFANQHDCADGDTPFHIFDRSSGMLKVFVDRPKAGLTEGYHLIAQAHRRGGMVMPYEENVTLVWEPFRDIGHRPVTYSAQEKFDAEYAHEWLLETLLPEVLKWATKSDNYDHTRRRWFWNLMPWLRRDQRPRKLKVSDLVYSLADNSFGRSGLRFANRKEGLSAIEVLQGHFHVYRSEAPIERESIVDVVKLTARLAQFPGTLDDHYVRGCIRVAEGDLRQGLVELANNPDRLGTTPFALDLALRALMAVYKDVGDFPESELFVVADLLQKPWARYHEDRLCGAYC